MRADTLVRVLRYTEGARSALNTPVTTWSEAGQVFGAYVPGGGQESEDAGQEMSVARAVFRVRRNALTEAISTEDRVAARGRTWEVQAVLDAGGTRLGFIDIHVIARSDHHA